jgi:hypothetical protein
VRRTGRTLPPAADRFVELAVEVCGELAGRSRPILVAS